MPFRWEPREHLALARHVLKWGVLAAPVGAVIGSAVALFLWALDRVTIMRWEHPALLYLLPVGGIGVGLMYHLFGKSVEGGNNLIMEQIHEPGGGVPGRMAPLVLLGTLATHLFGGSAGREGTAVQMGGSIASTVCRRLGLGGADTRMLLTAGIAGGFGAVFGTPLTGAVFALEVLAIGSLSYEAIIPCLVASIVGDRVTSAWGIHHTRYHVTLVADSRAVHGFSWMMAGKVSVAAVAFGLAGVLFAELTHGLHRIFKSIVPRPAFRPALGGLIVIALVLALGTRDYLGIGVTPDPHHPGSVCILSAFQPGGATPLSWWWKILFTAVTLASGFKGGEVTPLFFVGATLGHVMAGLLGAPVDLFAGLGFVAVFAGATNTPLACTIMGIELFGAGAAGSGFVAYLAIACFLSYMLSGHNGVYLSQRVGTPKAGGDDLPPQSQLHAFRELRPRLLRLFGTGGKSEGPETPTGQSEPTVE